MWERFSGAAAAKQGIFPIPRGHVPPPILFQAVAAAGASQWKSLSKSSRSAAGGQQLKAIRGGDSLLPLDKDSSLAGSSAATSLAHSNPSGVLLQVQEDTLETWGRVLSALGDPTVT